jgi:site-specific recombinase XerD
MGTTARHNDQLVRDYVMWLRDVRGHRPATIYNYAATFDPFLDMLGDCPLRSVRLSDLEGFLRRPRTKIRGPRVAPGTLRREVSTLRGLFAYLVARGHVDHDPSRLLVAPRRPKREPRVIADDLWRDVWSSELTDEARVLLGLGFFCGLRRAEIASLRTEQVDVSGLQLVRFERKGGGDAVLPFGMMLSIFEREMPLLFGARGTESFVGPLRAAVAARPSRGLLMPWADEIDALRSKRTRQHPLPVGTVDPQIASKRLAKLLTDLGLGGAFSMHCLRYSAATNLARAGVPVQMIQRLLGHSSITTTMVYVRVSNVELAEWFESGERHQNLREGFNRHG